MKLGGGTEISSIPLFPRPCQAGLLNFLSCFLFFKTAIKTHFPLYSQVLHKMLLKLCLGRVVASEVLNLSFFSSFPTVPDFSHIAERAYHTEEKISREPEPMDKARSVTCLLCSHKDWSPDPRHLSTCLQSLGWEGRDPRASRPVSAFTERPCLKK